MSQISQIVEHSNTDTHMWGPLLRVLVRDSGLFGQDLPSVQRHSGAQLSLHTDVCFLHVSLVFGCNGQEALSIRRCRVTSQANINTYLRLVLWLRHLHMCADHLAPCYCHVYIYKVQMWIKCMKDINISA